MIIIYKITDYFPETDQIAVKFCREKSPISIDDYNAIAINLKDIDAYDVESFSESLVKNSGLHRIACQEEQLDVIEENKPEDIRGNFEIEDLIGKIICVKYYDRKIKKLHMRRIEL